MKKFDESGEWVGDWFFIIGFVLLCFYDWKVGFGMGLMLGRVTRFTVLATRRYNEQTDTDQQARKEEG